MFIIVIPFLGVLVYLIAQHDGMRERSVEQAQDQQAAFDEYLQAHRRRLRDRDRQGQVVLDAGTITQDEFDAIKTKALSA